MPQSQKTVNLKRCEIIEGLLKFSVEKMAASKPILAKNEKIENSEIEKKDESSDEDEEGYEVFPEFISTYLEFDQEYIGPMLFLNFIDNIDIMKYVIKL